jgi:hypothetical protein
MKTIQAYGSNRKANTSFDILNSLRQQGNDRLIFGMENEILGRTFESLETLQNCTPDNAPWSLERDGSLADRGVEVVFDPTHSPVTLFRLFLECTKTAGMLSGSAIRYGLHLSVDASAFTPLQGCFFATLLNGWRNIGELIGGRPDNRWARYGVYKPSEFRLSTDKYRACSRRSKYRFEVRLFRSTLSARKLQTYVDYIQAVADIARYEIPTLLLLLRRGQRTPDGRSSSERWDGYPSFMMMSKRLLPKYATPALIAKIGGLI